jgi:hypothetical protein
MIFCLARRSAAPTPSHDFQIAALREGLAGAGEVVDIDWRSPLDRFDGFDLALLGTAWDYQDRAGEFMFRLEEIAARGVRRHRPPSARSGARGRADDSHALAR